MLSRVDSRTLLYTPIVYDLRPSEYPVMDEYGFEIYVGYTPDLTGTVLTISCEGDEPCLWRYRTEKQASIALDKLNFMLGEINA